MESARTPRLVVVCGLPGVGKTRHAVRVAEQHDLVRMSADHWLERLGIDVWDEDARAGIESLQWDLARDLLSCGQGIVIEWGTWSRQEREELRRGAQSLGAWAELHYLHAPVDVLHDRVQRRQAESPVITLEQLRAWADEFVVPGQQEVEGWDRFVSITTASNAGEETPMEVGSTTTTVRKAQDSDVEQLAELAVRAWGPVFTSLDAVFDERLARLLTPDWRAAQRRAVVEVCDDDVHRVIVAVDGGQVQGFAAYRLEDDDRRTGVVEILGVDPAVQGHGIGRAVLDRAIDELRAIGARVVMVETGGDEGHAAARRLYESQGFTLLPVARYFLDVRDGSEQ